MPDIPGQKEPATRSAPYDLCLWRLGLPAGPRKQQAGLRTWRPDCHPPAWDARRSSGQRILLNPKPSTSTTELMAGSYPLTTIAMKPTGAGVIKRTHPPWTCSEDSSRQRGLERPDTNTAA